MSRPVHIGNPPIEVVLRRSKRARRYSLRVCAANRRVSLTLPARASEAAALKFAEAREGWLRAALARLPEPHPVRFGARIPYRGRELLLCPGKGRRPVLGGDRIALPGGTADPGPQLRRFLIARARETLCAEAAAFAARLGKTIARVTLRDTRSRWGSCSESGRLMFSWRLIMAPPAVLSYVAAHEAAHLVEMNHSPAFWRLVEELIPQHARQRAWLHENGALLHSYRF